MTQHTASSTETALKVFTANGGPEAMKELIGTMLQTGQFDELVKERLNSIENGTFSDAIVKMDKVTNADRIETLHKTNTAERNKAEKTKQQRKQQTILNRK